MSSIPDEELCRFEDYRIMYDVPEGEEDLRVLSLWKDVPSDSGGDRRHLEEGRSQDDPRKVRFVAVVFEDTSGIIPSYHVGGTDLYDTDPEELVRRYSEAAHPRS